MNGGFASKWISWLQIIVVDFQSDSRPIIGAEQVVVPVEITILKSKELTDMVEGRDSGA